MAVFMINTCKFKGCGIIFDTLTELIRHIEVHHIDFAIEHEVQQPTCLPVSYILKVFSGEYTDLTNRKEIPSINGPAIKSKPHNRHSPAPSLASTTPTGSEMDDENYESESSSSIDSWSNIGMLEGDSSAAILKMITPTGTTTATDEQDKPYVCFINGCKKRYRNANGLKYHSKSAHSNSVESAKIYKCGTCGKVYKTPHGLKNHNNTQHANQSSKNTNHNPIQGNHSNVKVGKESVLANFVRMKSMPANMNPSPVPSATTPDIGPTASSTSGAPKTEAKVKKESVDPDEPEPMVVDSKPCPIIKAPTLQQHLLSPVVMKSASKLN